jgi:hypothetical protein
MWYIAMYMLICKQLSLEIHMACVSLDSPIYCLIVSNCGPGASVQVALVLDYMSVD